MHIRTIERADLPQIARLSAAAFIDDKLFSTLSPRRREFPEDWVRSFLKRHRLRLVTPTNWGVVCVSDEDDISQGILPNTIVGFAWWLRNSKKPSSTSEWTQNNTSYTCGLERTLLKIEDRYDGFFRSDRSADLTAVAAFQAEFNANNPWEHIPESWHLLHLVVHPDHQRKGIGGRLVHWGVERAREEEVPATLSASPSGRGLYARNGFQMIDAHRIVGQTLGDPAMIWDSTGKWTRRANLEEKVERFGLVMDVIWSDWAVAQMDRRQQKRIPQQVPES